MTLFQIIQILKEIALTQPNIKSATDGSIYDVMNTNPSVKYDVVHFSQTTHQSDEETDYYGLNIFYVSRLEDSLEDNRLQIQSIGKEILDNIIRTFCENWSIDFPIITYTPFTQKFNDLCAGCYCNLRLEIPKELICADDYVAEVVPGSGIKLQDVTLTITENGLRVITPAAEYDGIGEVRIVTDVPQAGRLEDKEVLYTQNGEYDIYPSSDYDGISSVAVSVDVPDRYEEGYEEGEADQKAKLIATSFTENNTYTIENGWSAVTVNVPQGESYEEGYEDGKDAQKAKMISISVTANGQYDREDGYSAITVNVPSDYQEGFEDGEEAQKAKLSALTATANGEYNRTDGWSAVTVNVPDRYNEGYDDGYEAGIAACSGLLATSITLNVADTITDMGTATTTYSPSTAYTDIYYTSSNPTKAIIDENTGVITVFENGTTTICTRDRMSGLQDCKDVNVVKSVETSITINVVDVITGTTTATTTVTPATATTNLVYSSSDTGKATINPSTGVITPVSSGMVTFCVTDTISSKQSCKTSYVISGSTQVSVLDFYYVTTAANQTNILFGGTAQDDDEFFDKFYNALITMIIDGVPVAKNPANIILPSVYGYKRYKQTFAEPGVHNVKYIVTRSLTGDGIAGLMLSDLLFADNKGDLHLVRANIGSGYEKLGNGTFQGGRELTAVTIPGTVTEIGPYTFEYTAIETLTIPNSVTGLTMINPGVPFEGEGICNNCTSLTSVTIGTGLRSIPLYTFQGCTSLVNVTINRTTPPTIEGAIFRDCTSLQNIYVPASSVNTYKSASGWSQYASKIKAIP